jgi:DNA polymerase-3 subunit gamma/tau
MRVLARTWQMLLKGITEVQAAGRPVAAAEMVLVRIAYAADLPTPDEVVRSLDNGSAPAMRPSGNGGVQAGPSAAMSSAPRFDAPRAEATRGGPRAALAALAQPASEAAPGPAAPPPLVIGRFEELIALASEKRDIGVKAALERDVRLVRCEDGRLEIALEKSASKTLVNDLARKFSQWTNRRWMVIVSAEAGQPTIKSQNDARDVELRTGVRADPLVAAVLARFPGAEIVDVRKADAAAVPPAPPDDGDDTMADQPVEDDSSAFGALMDEDDR